MSGCVTFGTTELMIEALIFDMSIWYIWKKVNSSTAISSLVLPASVEKRSLKRSLSLS